MRDGAVMTIDGTDYRTIEVLQVFPEATTDEEGNVVVPDRTPEEKDRAMVAARLRHTYQGVIVMRATAEIALMFGVDPNQKSLAFIVPVAQKATAAWCSDMDCAFE